ncbi:hypothetical protein SAMN04488066_11121 [Halorubrum aquaticum]|uniref:DUF8162 domain-containing protein n=1 Tax=Halorubrum aquaticum TaxID=387340 RepID=A0A1I3BBJ4_9EURY|nr:hypothetical protein [Halorubrum aquaticum]SFH59446.1 hypothetical protein SAMN04488066_11121 [Halorubrum aquaticum]
MVPSELTVVSAFAAVVLFAWSPLLAVERLRALFTWPTRTLLANYLVVGAVVAVVQVLSYFGVVLLVAGTGSVTGGEAAGIVAGVVVANLLVPGAAAVACLRLLPARGVWSPDSRSGLDGRIALAVGVGWYAVVASATFLAFALGIMFANLPT